VGGAAAEAGLVVTEEAAVEGLEALAHLTLPSPSR
jgi:hypothetical protein